MMKLYLRCVVISRWLLLANWPMQEPLSALALQDIFQASNKQLSSSWKFRCVCVRMAGPLRVANTVWIQFRGISSCYTGASRTRKQVDVYLTSVLAEVHIQKSGNNALLHKISWRSISSSTSLTRYQGVGSDIMSARSFKVRHGMHG